MTLKPLFCISLIEQLHCHKTAPKINHLSRPSDEKQGVKSKMVNESIMARYAGLTAQASVTKKAIQTSLNQLKHAQSSY